MSTKAQIDKAGEALVTEPQNTDATETLEFWRRNHFAPMGRVRAILENCIECCDFGCDAEVVLSNRIKRVESVVQKLSRQKTMRLSKMQDIAGIRLVLNTTCSHEQGLRNLAQLSQHCFLTLSKHAIKVKGKLFDYVEHPKESGYRAIHFVVECDTEDAGFSSIPVEVQLRTKIQHLWAMAVETAGMFYNQALKASEGSEEWLTFFKMCSAAVSHIEGGKIVSPYTNLSIEELKNELNQYATKRTFFQKMSNIKVITDILQRDDHAIAYCILELNMRQEKNKLYRFRDDQSDLANEMYTKIEQSAACVRGDAYAVLISVDHVKNLRILYPSYFLDVSEFMSLLRKFLVQ